MILHAEGLSRHFRLGQGLLRPPRFVRAVSDVSLSIEAGTCLGIVGESGSGKSTLGRLLLGLLAPNAGRVRFDGQDLAAMSLNAWRAVRRDLVHVHQNPRLALDPRWRVADQVAEPLVIHRPDLDRTGRNGLRDEAFEAVGLSLSLLDRFPHQLSGGQLQRVVLARALTLRPRVIVMDEPTSALDVSVQAQVMQLIGDLKARFGLTYVFISHDLRNLRRIADRIAVMYAGRIIEDGDAESVCRTPAHPYTQHLLAAVPTLRRAIAPAEKLSGEPPDPAALPPGCAFHPRCPLALERCTREAPALLINAGDRRVACHRVDAPLATAELVE